jgi:formyltetrahydrofolate deformylase
MIAAKAQWTGPMSSNSYVFTLACNDRPGIVAAFSAALAGNGFNITDAQQFNDVRTGMLFARVVFESLSLSTKLDKLKSDLGAALRSFDASWSVRELRARRRVAILVSKFHHCLADLVYRWRAGELNMDAVAIISNHPPENCSHLSLGDIPFHHLPLSMPSAKEEQEAKVEHVLREANVDLVILARYMQILTGDFNKRWAGRCINIHHSFLPSFKGAKPYHQAYERGVKLIGATAHYVTSDLDEGPIIEQDVERITHRDGPEELIRKGRDIERRVLARAVRYHLEDRLFLNGNSVVVFPE